MKKASIRWKTAILSSGIVFQLFLAVELFLFYDVIIMDPAVHKISYESWFWFIDEWIPPAYWSSYSETITTALAALNRMFQLLFGIFLIYIFIHRDRFSFRAKTIILTVIAIVLADVSIRYYIKYNVYFYRLYMYSIYNEMMALYMLYCGRRYRPSDTDTVEQTETTA